MNEPPPLRNHFAKKLPDRPAARKRHGPAGAMTSTMSDQSTLMNADLLVCYLLVLQLVRLLRFIARFFTALLLQSKKVSPIILKQLIFIQENFLPWSKAFPKPGRPLLLSTPKNRVRVELLSKFCLVHYKQ